MSSIKSSVSVRNIRQRFESAEGKSKKDQMENKKRYKANGANRKISAPRSVVIEEGKSIDDPRKMKPDTANKKGDISKSRRPREKKGIPNLNCGATTPSSGLSTPSSGIASPSGLASPNGRASPSTRRRRLAVAGKRPEIPIKGVNSPARGVNIPNRSPPTKGVTLPKPAPPPVKPRPKIPSPNNKPKLEKKVDVSKTENRTINVGRKAKNSPRDEECDNKKETKVIEQKRKQSKSSPPRETKSLLHRLGTHFLGNSVNKQTINNAGCSEDIKYIRKGQQNDNNVKLRSLRKNNVESEPQLQVDQTIPTSKQRRRPRSEIIESVSMETAELTALANKKRTSAILPEVHESSGDFDGRAALATLMKNSLSPASVKKHVSFDSSADLRARTANQLKEDILQKNEIDENMGCQNPSCEAGETGHVSKVCHHTDCKGPNSHRPLMLCTTCDTLMHSAPTTAGHLRFDVIRKGGNLSRNISTRSLPDVQGMKEESESRDDRTDGGGGTTQDADNSDDGDGSVKNTRLKRKKAIKGRRCQTEGSGKRTTTQSHKHTEIPPTEDGVQATAPEESPPVELAEAYKFIEFDPPKIPDLEFHSDNSDTDEEANNFFNKPPLDGSSDTMVGSIHSDGSQSDLNSSDVSANQNAETVSTSSDHVIRRHKGSLDGSSLSETDDNVIVERDELLEEDDEIDVNCPPVWIPHPMPYRTSRKHSAPSPRPHSSYTRDSGNRKMSAMGYDAKPHSGDDLIHASASLQKYSLGTEYFTLKFDVLKEPDMDIAPALKGVSLRTTLVPYLDKRGISVDAIDTYLAASKTPLPLECDCFALGGTSLHIKAKDGNSPFTRDPNYGRTGSSTSLPKPPKLATQRSKEGNKEKVEKKLTGSQRRGKNVVDDVSLSDTSPHGSLTSAESKKISQMKMQKGFSIFSPFNKNSQEKPDQLRELLNHYSQTGLPPMPDLLTLGERQFDESSWEIERHWTDLFDNSADLTKKQRDQQEAIWELLSTEVKFIKNIKIIIDLFMCCLLNLQNEVLLNEIETEKVFSNVRDIHRAHCEFWEDHLIKVLNHSRETKAPLNPTFLIEGFSQFRDVFRPYTKYCLEQIACLEYLKIRYRDNDLFRGFIQWAEEQKQCNRLKLQDLIVTPMLRLTKYKLLVKAILKKTDNEDQRKELIQMMDKVDRFVNEVNMALHQQHERERLSMIIDRLEAYDAVEPPTEECMKLISDFCKLDLTCPVPGCGPHQPRHLLKEGNLRMKDSLSSRTEVYIFLFTDLLLITKPQKRGDKVKVIKPPMRLDKVVVHALKDQSSFLLVYLNEYHVASACYTLHGDVAGWLDLIVKAQESYQRMRASAMERSEARLVYLDDDTEDDFAFIQPQAQLGALSADQPIMSRMDSGGSVDMFMPNIGPSQGDPEVGKSRLFSLASLDEVAEPGIMGGGHRIQRPPKPQLSLPESELRGERSPGRTPPSSPHGSLRYHPNTGTRAKTGYMDFHLPNRPDLIFIDESLKSKLNQRRTSRTERRYHTADAIQDMRKDNKDSSIHKRLSWNYGTVDINLDERAGILKSKAFSSDSLRSMPSSSGVSSTGSSHLSQESEISEETDRDTPTLLSTDKTSLTDCQFRNNLDAENGGDDRLCETNLETNFPISLDSPETVQTISQTSLSSTNKPVSKSMPDISKINISTVNVKEGIGSVELSNGDGQKRKMTHAQILHMRKQLLLNSTLEASEV